jgi:hypothetical protein
VMCECRCCVQGQEKEVLDDDWSTRDEGSGEGRVLFESGPSQVDVEEEKEGA